MSTFTRQTEISAPVSAVWAALADIGNIATWNPGVIESHNTTAETTGLGACRYCDLGGKNYLHEEVVAYEPENRITMRITETNLPFQQADIQFDLQPAGDHTLVSVSPMYKIKYGPLGSLMDLVMVRRTYAQGMDNLLAGLKDYVESRQ
jgi:uncharacterized protein YndB with AHSA1/START domain